MTAAQVPVLNLTEIDGDVAVAMARMYIQDIGVPGLDVEQRADSVFHAGNYLRLARNGYGRDVSALEAELDRLSQDST